MTKPARRACYLLPAAVALTVIAAPCAAFANSTGTYLNWSAKAQPADTPAPAEQVDTPSGAYPVPPSPYGQVGDPYARSLRWPAKQAPGVASISPPPQPEFAAAPAVSVRNPAPVSVSQPVPMRAPQPPAVVPLPAPQSAPVMEREDPGLADDPDLTPEAPLASQPVPKAMTSSAAKAPPVVAAPSPVHADAAPPPAAVAPALTHALATDGAYEVPATSKYAARIAAARAAQLPVAEAPQSDQKTGKADAKPTATAPEPDVSLASQETDHVFIPGEQYKTPADEPRLYSLHRQYGMRPDPIQVTPGATGALLTVSPDEGGDPNDDDTANGKKSDTDKN
jgi:hypothetical protein